MYFEKLESILDDIEDKELEIAGGSVVGIVLSIVNSLITYISKLTAGKKAYEQNEEKIKEILYKAQNLKKRSLEVIDKDKEILEEILSKYKLKKENNEIYQEVCKKATYFCMDVVNIAKDTLNLSYEISKVGNKMLESDFKICEYYAKASILSAVENVYINVKYIDDDKYREEIKGECEKILENIRL